MQHHIPSIVLLIFLLAGAAGAMQQQSADTPSAQLIIGGAVRRVLGSGMFILEDRRAEDGELMVLAPDAAATPVAGATVIAQGLLRQFGTAELEKIHGWNDVLPRLA